MTDHTNQANQPGQPLGDDYVNRIAEDDLSASVRRLIDRVYRLNPNDVETVLFAVKMKDGTVPDEKSFQCGYVGTPTRAVGMLDNVVGDLQAHLPGFLEVMMEALLGEGKDD